MALLSQWLKSIILLILLATFVDLLLPNGAMQKYVRMVMGLLLLMTFLAPVFILFNGNTTFDEVVTDLLRNKSAQQMISKDEILTEAAKLKETQQKVAIEQMRKEIETRVKEDIEKNYNYIVKDVIVGINPSGSEYVDLQLVQLEVVLQTVSSSGEAQESSTATSTVKPVVIDPVTTTIDDQTTTEQKEPIRMKDIEDWLGKQWSLKQGQVIVSLKEEEGRNAS